MMDWDSEEKLLEGLLGIYSPTGQETEAVDYLVAQMRLSGFQAGVDEIGNAIGVLGDGPNLMVLLGHIDTVPGFINVVRSGDKLWGRGAVDAKGPLACFTCAASRAGAIKNWRIVVVGAVGEEGDSRGAKYILDRYKPDIVIIGEPSNWDRITLGYKGSVWVEYELQRQLTHSAAQAESACQAAVGFWNRLEQHLREINANRIRFFDQLTPSLREMSSHTDGFFETARFIINFRLPPDLAVVEVEAMLKDVAQEALNASMLKNLVQHVDIKVTHKETAYRAEKNTALCRSFLSVIRKYGGKPAFTVKTGTSDMNTVGPTWKCQMVAYGPGNSDLDHTPDEHIMVSEYHQAVQVLSDVIQMVTGQTTDHPE